MKPLLILLLFLNLRAYYFMLKDKRLAIKGKYRIPEKKLFRSGMYMGGFGLLAGMLPPLNHKKNKRYFWGWTLLIVAQNLLLIYGAYYLMANFA